MEVPAGGIETGEGPLEAAKRELQEELGLTAQDWKFIGKFQAENAYINNFAHVFIAHNLSGAGKHDRLAEGINKTEIMSIEQALQMIKDGEITDSQSMSALILVALNLGVLV